KVTERLTLTLGFRYDYQMAFNERYNRFSSFDATAPNPAAGNRPGAIVYATPSNNTFDHPLKDAIGPRIGFAYNLAHRTVLRGGYGMYYSGVPFTDGANPITGFFTNPT